MTNALDSRRKRFEILKVALQCCTWATFRLHPEKERSFYLIDFWVAILGIRAVFTKLLQQWCIEVTMHNPIQRFVRSRGPNKDDGLSIRSNGNNVQDASYASLGGCTQFLIPKSPWRKLDYPHNVHQDDFLVRHLPDCRWVANSSMPPSVPAGIESRSAVCSAVHYTSASTV